MEKKDHMPLWFFLEQPWVGEVFLIDDRSWLVMMAPVVIWYYLSLRWIDNNTGWEEINGLQ